MKALLIKYCCQGLYRNPICHGILGLISLFIISVLMFPGATYPLEAKPTQIALKRCPYHWPPSSNQDGCDTGLRTLQLGGVYLSEGCSDGWVRSSAPGGCSPNNFTLQTRFGGIDRAEYHCVFGDECNAIIEVIKSLGGVCETDGFDTTCELPSLID